MCRNIEALVFLVHIQPHIPFLWIRRRQNCVLWLWIDRDEAFQVRISFYGVNQPHLVKVVDISSVFQHHDDPMIRSNVIYLLVFGQAYRPHLGLEAQLTDTLECHVVPEEDFVCRKLGPLATADKCENVGAEQHFHNTNAASEPCHYYHKAILTSDVGIFERDRRKNSEACLKSDGETGCILVEISRQDSVVEVLRDEFLLLLEGFVTWNLLLVSCFVHL